MRRAPDDFCQLVFRRPLNAVDNEDFDRTSFGFQLHYLSRLRKLVEENQALGKSGNQLIEAVLPELTREYSHWDYFKFVVERNILDTEAELSGKKSIPQTQLRK